MGGILSGGYKVVTGMSGVFGGSPDRAAADEELQSKLSAASVGIQETQQDSSIEAGKLRTLGSQVIAKQKVAYANSGVDPTSGTAANVMADTRLMSELDARMAENNAARKVRGFKEMKRQANAEWHNRLNQEEQDSIGSILGGVGSIAGGVLG